MHNFMVMDWEFCRIDNDYNVMCIMTKSMNGRLLDRVSEDHFIMLHVYFLFLKALLLETFPHDVVRSPIGNILHPYS